MDLDSWLTQSTNSMRAKGTVPVLVVVGFDGSEPAQRALLAATRLVEGRTGGILALYVAQRPWGASLSAEADADIVDTFDEIEGDLRTEVGALMAGVEERWHFERQDGLTVDEIVAASEELAVRSPDATILVVVGGSRQRLHHVLGSVPVGLARHAAHPLVVVP